MLFWLDVTPSEKEIAISSEIQKLRSIWKNYLKARKCFFPGRKLHYDPDDGPKILLTACVVPQGSVRGLLLWCI